MKFVWLSLTATAALSISMLAQAEPQNQDVHSIKDKNLSPSDIIEIYDDRDQDMTKSFKDQCQNSEAQQPVNSIGCALDSDNDGVYDKNDQCPGSISGRNVNFLGCEVDGDYDGVLDANDRCPLTPLGTKVDVHGCKLVNDSDGDGVLDTMDLCPDTPAGIEVNQKGCKPRTSVLVNIVFDTGSYAIRPDQEKRLQDDLAPLKDLRDDEMILITGHTDYVGRAADNIQLSWNRALSVKDYLTTNSDIEPASIYLLGKGESEPLADNSTASGRQENRRIELEVMIKEELPAAAAMQTPQ